MAGTFTVRWNAAKNRVEETLVGQWDADTMHRYEVEFRTIVDAIPSPKWAMLVDVRNSAPQAEENQKRIEEIVQMCVAKGCVKVVALAPKVVVTMQMKRLAHSAGADDLMAYASTEAEAEALLSAVLV
jgi:hypothetical protein